MTFSKQISGTWPLNFLKRGKNLLLRRSKRKYPVSMFIVHHAATTSDASLKAAYWSTKRELSSTYAMDKSGRVFGVVAEEQKPNTSASIADHRAVTIEIVNQSGEPHWTISDVQFEALAKLIADVATRHRFPITRSHVIGHREVRGRFGDGYATACPGPYLYARMDELVARAKAIQSGATVKPAPAKPEATPAPKPTTPSKASNEEPWRKPIGRTMRLASRWGKFRTYQDASALRRQWGWFPAGDYKVTGQYGNAFKIVRGKTVGWIHGSARDGIQ